jgi:Nucleotidyl transferase AbiEii toxin, Type IV TA system
MTISRETAGGRAYIDLQRRAKDTRRNTQELIQLYILEGFLARLAESPVREKFVLKGGVLLAAFGNRCPTRDVDFAGRDIGNDGQQPRADQIRPRCATFRGRRDRVRVHQLDVEADDFPRGVLEFFWRKSTLTRSPTGQSL